MQLMYVQFLSITNLDSAEPWQTGFQDPATPVMEGIINLHNDIMFFLVVIGTLTGWMLFRTCVGYDEGVHPTASKVVHGTTIEIVWTITPALVLMIIAVPSFALCSTKYVAWRKQSRNKTRKRNLQTRLEKMKLGENMESAVDHSKDEENVRRAYGKGSY